MQAFGCTIYSSYRSMQSLVEGQASDSITLYATFIIASHNSEGTILWRKSHFHKILTTHLVMQMDAENYTKLINNNLGTICLGHRLLVLNSRLD
jgi:hypothetical protein